MMNPEMMKLAMEQMSKMTPEQMAEMQRTMGNLTPAQMQSYQQQAANLSSDDIRRARTQMNSMTPDQLRQAAGQAGASVSAQEKYKFDAANRLKADGNQLHSSKQYAAAIEKYKQAKSNLTGQPSEQAKELQKACMLNICSCRLNLGQFASCVQECTEVLSTDRSNRKALYRRGQAYTGLSRYHEAVSDLTQALDLSPANEKAVIAAKLKEAQERAASQPAPTPQLPAAGASAALPASQVDKPSDRSNNAVSSSNQATARVEEDGHVSDADSDNVEEIPAQSQPQVPVPSAQNGAPMGMPPGMPPGMDSAEMRNMMQNPQMMRQMTDMMSNMDPAQMQSMARMAGAPEGMQISPEMMKAASSMMANMSPEMMQSMMSMASNRGATSPAANAASTSGQQPAPGAGQMPQMTPELMDQMQKSLSDPATADMITAFTQNMTPEDLASLLKQSGGVDVTPEQAAQYLGYAKKISPRNMRFLFKVAAYGVPFFTMARHSKHFVDQHPLVFWAIVVLLVALVLRLLGWV